jgi:hypothetical protein
VRRSVGAVLLGSLFISVIFRATTASATRAAALSAIASVMRRNVCFMAVFLVA